MIYLSLISILRCFNGCRDHTRVSGHGTRIWNMSDKPIELQIRVGSILKKVHTLKPGSSRRLKAKKIYKAYMPGKSNYNGDGIKSLLYYYDETCRPYIWIHDTGCDFSRMVKQQYALCVSSLAYPNLIGIKGYVVVVVVKQQYISLEDLRDFSEIRVVRDHQKGCVSVRKRSRPDFC